MLLSLRYTLEIGLVWATKAMGVDKVTKAMAITAATGKLATHHPVRVRQNFRLSEFYVNYSISYEYLQ